MKNPLYKVEISHKTDEVWYVSVRYEKDKRSFRFTSLSKATEWIAAYLIQNGRGV